MKNLRKRRIEKGLTCEALGKLVCVQKAAISKYELGQIQPSQEILIKLSEVLNCTTDFLLDITDEPNYKNPGLLSEGTTNKIRDLRMQRKWTQEELAEKIKQTKSNISKYETGTLDPSTQVLIALSDVFNVSVDYLLGKSDNPVMQSNLPQNTTPIIDSLERNKNDIEDLTPDEISEMASQMEFLIKYVKNKRNSQKTE